VLADAVGQAAVEADEIGTVGELGEELDVAAEIPGDVVSEGDAVDPVEAVAVVARVADDIELRHQTHAPAAGERNGQRRNQAAFDGVIAEMVLVRRPFDVGHQRERGVAAVVAPEVDLQARGDVTKTGSPVVRAGDAVVLAVERVNGEHGLEVDVVREADLHVQVGVRQRRSLRVGAVPGVALARVRGEVHLDLPPAGVDRVGAFGQVGTIGAELAELRGRRAIEKRVRRFVGRRVRRDHGKGQRQQRAVKDDFGLHEQWPEETAPPLSA
jgi:hypothetical protein